MSRPFLYCDILGRTWAVERLDALLADESVRLTVEWGARVGQCSEGARIRQGYDGATWSPAAVIAWARRRYRREEPAALMLLLVSRLFDLGTGRDLEGGAA